MVYQPFLDCLRLLIFTGARRNELTTLKWEHVNLEQGCLTLPDTKTGFKVIHLNPPGRNILARTLHIQGNPYVFPGIKRQGHIVGIQQAWDTIRTKANLSDVHLHDLRHSFASVGAAGGLGLPIIGSLLGHQQTSTTQRYAHLSADPQKHANDYIGEELQRALGEAPRKHKAPVVSLRKKRK